jgi:hypothetical protein
MMIRAQAVGLLAVMAVLAGGIANSALACPDLSSAPNSRWTTRLFGAAQFLVTPCGEPFFSIGVNVVNALVPGDDTEGRTPYDWTRFYRSTAEGVADTRSRLGRWGFNSLGGWSAEPAQFDMPAIVYLGLGVDGKYHWFDAYDPSTEIRLRAMAREMVAPYRRDPRRIGYFTDNETGWWSGALFFYYSRQPAANHTKRRFIELLQTQYGGDFHRFATDFLPPAGVNDWAGLLAATRPTRLRPGTQGVAAVRRWTAEVSEHYYEMMGRVFRSVDPDALLFGDRLPIYYDPVAVRAMARHMDVLGVNYNVDAHDGWIARYFFDGLRELSGGKPVLVSEWFFAAHENRTGNRNVGHLMTVGTQEQRARGAAAATLNFAAVPEIVGMHWFQYPDHPRGGRSDGEDYNFGLVDIENRPYEGLVEALASANREALVRHRSARIVEDDAGGRIRVPRAAVKMGDGTLSDWPKPASLMPRLKPAPGEVAFGEAYLAWDGEALYFATIGQDYYDIDLLAYDDAFPLSESYRFDIGVDAGAGPRRFSLFFVPPKGRGKNYPIMQALLCAESAADIASCRTPAGAAANYFGADQPRIVAEARLPWPALGMAGPPADGRIRVEIAGTAWHRSRWISLSGLPPAEAMAQTERWRDAGLAEDER